MDFFSAAGDPTTVAVSLSNDSETTFAQAIANRFGHSADILTTRLTPTTTHPVTSPDSPMANMSISPNHSSPVFIAVPPTDLDSWLHDTHTLIVDIRPHAAHSSARIPKAISLCVPSTLLKRPLFSLQKLSAMLPSASARNRFSTWRTASRIIVYDADSTSIGDSSNINGLLKKFKSDGFEGDLAWLKGGFQSVWKERRELVDTNPPTPEADGDEDDAVEHVLRPNSVLRTRHLPMAAFSLSSTTISLTGKKQLPTEVQPMTTTGSNNASNPFFDAIRQNTELTHGITDRIPLTLPRRVRSRIHELPFPWLQDIARRAAKTPHRPSTNAMHMDDTTSSSESDAQPDEGSIDEGKEALAMQFYKIELAEQRRLMGVMEHHSRESGVVANQEVPFPFSITAGVEKGAKNRYRHIWPFEHARVRLHQSKGSTDTDDYINASYVQPLGTNRRYIATQGPLPATFTDFWTLVWQQNVHVIVMLTREVEGAMVKCGSYWTDAEFGPLRLKLVGTEGLAPTDLEDEEGAGGGGRGNGPRTAHPGFFGDVDNSNSNLNISTTTSGAKSSKKFPLSANPHLHSYRSRQSHMAPRSSTVKRTFELSHVGYPAAPPRRIVHLQYLEWPDMNVPDDARGVLGLVWRVEDAVRETGGGRGRGNTILPKGGLGGEVPPPVPSLPIGVGPAPIKRKLSPAEQGTTKASPSTSRSSITPSQVPPQTNSTSESRASLDELDSQTGVVKYALKGTNPPPVLLHCSAGVGRTGGFIAVDAILDGVRREVREGFGRKRRKEGKEKVVEADAMDVDPKEEGDEKRVRTMPVVITSGLTRGVSERSQLETDPGSDDVGEGKWDREGVTPRERRGAGAIVHVPAISVSLEGESPGGDQGQAEAEGDDDRMQVDKVDKKNLKQNNKEAVGLEDEQHLRDHTSNTREAGTMRWAENVRDEMGGGFGGMQTQSPGQGQGQGQGQTQAAAGSKSYGHGPGTSTSNPSGASTTTISTTGSSFVGSSSSLGTSVSPSPSVSSSSCSPPSRKNDENTGVNDSFDPFVGRNQHPLSQQQQHPHPHHEPHKQQTWPIQPTGAVQSLSQLAQGPQSAPVPIPAQAPSVASTSTASPTPGDLFHAVLQQQVLAEQRRMRTISAPFSDMSGPSGSSGSSGSVGFRKGMGGFKLKLPMPTPSIGNIQTQTPSTYLGYPGSLPTQSHMAMRTSVGSPPQGVMSSEGEAPSRSQSPSDETSSSNAGVAPPPPPRRVQAKTRLQLQQPPMLLQPQPQVPIGSTISGQSDTGYAIAGGSAREASEKSYDYKEPRPLHQVYTPPPLTTFSDPILEVLQDIREQRMSLCQSLRQYVFVHAAIIEGSLMVLDEEKEIAEGLGPRNVLRHTYEKQHRERQQQQQELDVGYEPGMGQGVYGYWPPDSAMGLPDSASTIPPASSRSVTSYGAGAAGGGGSGSGGNGGRSSPTHSSSGRSSRSRSTSRSSRRHAPYAGASNPKRPSSPTELLKEDKEGALLHAKRPSIKRKQRSGEESGLTKEEVARYHPVPVRVNSGALSMGGVSAPSEASGREVV
ncbi:hypothetical protein CPB83DRAFT_842337 [Crepidotus variabilis]|uniref:protein-tyrosine-phosphatase n=1 Tax=Crepidotus variabilis TaxID=179855 RepID=A0A9P6JX85_9AGAR|nr:hypothetical protein CPB83DRAFT_842337 [Crepidotus variabilis]